MKMDKDDFLGMVIAGGFFTILGMLILFVSGDAFGYKITLIGVFVIIILSVGVTTASLGIAGLYENGSKNKKM